MVCEDPSGKPTTKLSPSDHSVVINRQFLNVVSPVTSSMTPVGRGSAATGQIPASSPISIARTLEPYRLLIATEIRKFRRRSIARVNVTPMTSPVVTTAPAVRRIMPVKALTVTPMSPSPTGLFISEGVANNTRSHNCKSRPFRGKNIYGSSGGIIHGCTTGAQHGSSYCNQEGSMSAFHHTPWTSERRIIFREFSSPRDRNAAASHLPCSKIHSCTFSSS